MRKYKNTSNHTLALDCLSYTHYMRPGETASLPLTRDVRHYSRLNKLVLIKEKKEVNLLIEKPRVVVEKQEKRLHSQKEKTEKMNKKIEKTIIETENE